jgi:hypothetical protein
MGVSSRNSRDKDITSALESWIDLSPKMCRSILATPRPQPTPLVSQPDGDVESEALTVVVTSFLLDLCHRYPEHKNKIVGSILDELKRKFEDGDNYTLSKLAHAVVLIVKALPKTRIMVLRKGLMSPIVSRLEMFATGDLDCKKDLEWPMWLPHFLLIADMMAQPASCGFFGRRIQAVSDRVT